MSGSNNRLWWIAGALFVLLAAAAAYKAMPLLNPELQAVAPLDSKCDLRAGPCTSALPGGGSVTFAIRTEGIPLVKPLDLEVRLAGMDASSVEVDFVGIGMNMGYNRPRLEAQGDGVYSGTGMLPVCVRAAMEWEARVLVKSERGLLAAPFRFITVKDGAVLPGSNE
ncbi:MAG: hypothetical protein OQL28_12110 [Sedimenticola sp.]|nr:hypothetical protein [Sedimenticola sp.]